MTTINVNVDTVNVDTINVTIEDEDETLVACDRCWQLVPVDELTTVEHDGSDEQWCDHCLNSDAEWCDHCDSWHASTTEVHVRCQWRYNSTENWCDDCVDRCAVTCDYCDELWDAGSADINEVYTYSGGWETICYDCIDDNFYQCADCGSYVQVDDAIYVERDDSYYCPDCSPRHEHGDHLHGYEHTYGALFYLDDGTAVPAWKLRGADALRLFLGIEIETDDNDCAGRLADDVYDEFGEDRVVAKHDGSLGEEGVEFVGQPMTPRYILECRMWERIFEMVRDHGGLSHDAGSCGFHIHLSRSFFVNHDAVYRLDRLFTRFRPEMVRFSRRRYYDMGWCEIPEHDDLKDIKDVQARKFEWRCKKNHGYRARYVAVNDTNERTVEVRLWRGTLNVETFRATVEFTTGLALLANTISDEFADRITWRELKSLVRYVLTREGLPYDDFDAYLERREL